MHLFKSLRNNWISERNRQLTFTIPGHSNVTASWEDVRDLHAKESDNIIRRTTLTRQACFPSHLELQKVGLVFKVINEKTVAALSEDGKYETAQFIKHFDRIWKFVNAKHPESHIRLEFLILTEGHSNQLMTIDSKS